MAGINLIGFQFEKIKSFDPEKKKGTVVPLFLMTQAIDSFEAILGEQDGKVVAMYYELSIRSGKTERVTTDSFLAFSKLLQNPAAGKPPDIITAQPGFRIKK